MTLYHITDGFFHTYMLPDWEDYWHIVNNEDTIIDITIEEYGKLFPQPPITIYDLDGESYLANWVDPPIEIEVQNQNEIAAKNITVVKMSYEEYVKLFGENPQNTDDIDITKYTISQELHDKLERAWDSPTN